LKKKSASQQGRIASALPEPSWELPSRRGSRAERSAEGKRWSVFKLFGRISILNARPLNSALFAQEDLPGDGGVGEAEYLRRVGC
jgi:hypothetical protein